MVASFSKTFHRTSGLTEFKLETAILYTLAYSDIFDFPPTAEELHRYLIGFRAEPAQVDEALRNLYKSKSVTNHGEYFALPGREGNFTLRQKRVEVSVQLWREATRYGKWIEQLPYVRMAAVTGALVSNNVEAGADLDFFIITEPGWLWTTRALILTLDRISSRAGSRAHICPNYMITTHNLALYEQDLFTAQEMVRMIPLVGFEIYDNFRQENSWTDDFLPNAQGLPSQVRRRLANGRLSYFAEKVWNNPISRWVERWEMRRKIRRFSAMAAGNEETCFSADLCKGHFAGHRQQTLLEFEKRVRALGIAHG